MNKYFFIFLILALFFSLNTKAESTLLDTSRFITEGHWSNPNNWESGQLPSINSKVVVEANAIIDIQVEIKELEVDDEVSINIQKFYSLKINRHLENEGSIKGEGELIFNGNSAQFIRGEGIFHHIRVNNPSTVHVKDEIQVYGNLYIEDGNLLTFNHLNLKCDFTTNSTAQVVRVQGNITGKVTTEQCFPARRAYRMVSPSVNTSSSIRENWQEDAEGFSDDSVPEGLGTHITGLNPGPGPAHLGQDGDNGFDYNPSGDASMFEYSHSLNEFVPIGNTDETTLTAGSPYMVLIRGDRHINIYSNTTTPTSTRLRSNGELITDNFSSSQISNQKNGFSLIGNPYHAQIDMSSVLKNSINIRNDVYYVWDPTMGGVQDLEESELGGRGAFVIIDLSTVTNSSNSEANQYLQPMQAAFVQTKDNGFAQINFSEQDKALSPSQTEILSQNDLAYIDVQLYNQLSYEQGSTPSDSFRVKFGDSYSDSNEDDILKLPNVDENLTRVLDQDLIALERRSMPNEEIFLPLYVDQYRRENYVLKFETTDEFPAQIYLIDHYLNTETPIGGSDPSYEFNVDSSVAGSTSQDRFSIKISPETLSVQANLLASVRLHPNPTRDSFQLSGLENLTDVQVNIFNLIGQQLYTHQAGVANTLIIDDFRPGEGVYLVNLKSDNMTKTFKLLIKN
ncbi:T9SS type A sorting domain-containing protein [Psychroflexus tropicus]|uniref:T9SS type A sorting domain-containing protein n=1 Tax=Psychroflexus tropicus TaxID=197345 RepID=UPI000366F000|nr:T9SS type A sorting domain-containing protein [Psychroflexus tropicus]